MVNYISGKTVSELPEAVVRRCPVKKVFLKISKNSQENTCARVSFLIKLGQVFSCEFCEIFKNTFLKKHIRWLLLNFRITIIRNSVHISYTDLSLASISCVNVTFLLP